MAIRIVGVDLPQNKRGEIALTYIYCWSRFAPEQAWRNRIDLYLWYRSK